MISLAVIILLVVSILIAKSAPTVAGVLDLAVASLILFFEVIPGKASPIDWILMILLFLGGAAFLFTKDGAEKAAAG